MGGWLVGWVDGDGEGIAVVPSCIPKYFDSLLRVFASGIMHAGDLQVSLSAIGVSILVTHFTEGINSSAAPLLWLVHTDEN